MDKSTHEEHLKQPLQTNNKQFKIPVTFLFGYSGFFNITNSNNKFCFQKTNTDEDDFIQITIPSGAYEIESLNNEIRRIIIDECHFCENEYPFTIKPNFPTLGSIVIKSPQGPISSFVFDDSIRSLLRFHETILFKEYNLSPDPVDIISFGNIVIGTDIAKEMIFKCRKVEK